MRSRVPVPIKIVNGEQWGDLASFAHTHEICGEKVDQRKDISFAGGHRVRLFRFSKSVHWKLPGGIELDIQKRPQHCPRGGVNGRDQLIRSQ
jgi:hypothetical protein